MNEKLHFTSVFLQTRFYVSENRNEMKLLFIALAAVTLTLVLSSVRAQKGKAWCMIISYEGKNG